MKYLHLAGIYFFTLLTISTHHLIAANANQLCGAFDTSPIRGGVYKIQNNIWGAGTAQCISPLNDQGFTVDSSNHNNGTSGAPASYPSIWRGCHWTDCTPSSGMPLLASEVKNATLHWSFSTIGNGSWNAAAEAWFKKSATPGAPDGTELMLWLDSNGPVQPGGSQVGTANIAGATWEVWFNNSGWNFVTYRRQTAVSAITTDLRPFMDDAIARGYLEPSWYLMDMEAGFEIWQGGAGLQTNNFTFEVNSITTENNPPVAQIIASPIKGKVPLRVDFSGVDSSDPDDDQLSFSWVFGDGKSGTGENQSHLYTEPGDYNVTLTVSDGSLQDTANVRIIVLPEEGQEKKSNILMLIRSAMSKRKS